MRSLPGLRTSREKLGKRGEVEKDRREKNAKKNEGRAEEGKTAGDHGVNL